MGKGIKERLEFGHQRIQHPGFGGGKIGGLGGHSVSFPRVVEQKGNDVAYGEVPEAAVKLLQSWGMRPLKVISGDWIMGW